MSRRSTRPDLVFCHPSDELYGADRMLVQMIDALPEGIRAEVWLPTDLTHPQTPLCELIEARGVPVRHVSLPVMRRAYKNVRGLFWLLWQTALLALRLARARPRGVYATTSATFLALPAAWITAVPVRIGHVQELWAPSERAAVGSLARWATRLVAISGAVRDQLPPGLRQRCALAVNGTPEPATQVSMEGRNGTLTYAVASRWNSWKGHRTLLAAWDAAGCPGRLLVFGGPPMSGPRVDVPALARTLGDPGSVLVVGEVPDAAERLGEADVVVMPSDQPEPFGLVAIEAFARGRPVIASHAGGLAEIVTDGHDGWVYEPGDVAALAAILGRLTRADVALAAGHARRSYLERFSPERFATDWRRAVFGPERH